VRYTHGGEVWDVHGRWDEGVDFIFSPAVTPTKPVVNRTVFTRCADGGNWGRKGVVVRNKWQ